MSWLKKISQTEEESIFGDASLWKPGQLVLLNNIGVDGFAVASVLEWDEAASADKKFSVPEGNQDSVISYNPFGSMDFRRGESVPLQYLKYYGKPHYPNYDGGVHFVGPQNVYATLGDIIKKSLRSTFPDLLLSVYQKPHIQEFSKDFPQLVGESPFGLIEYETYHIRGYDVLVLRDPSRMKMNENPSFGYNQKEFYWAIPELKVRSQYMENKVHDIEDKVTKKLWWEIFGQGGNYRTVDEAASAAEKFIDYFVFMESPTSV